MAKSKTQTQTKEQEQPVKVVKKTEAPVKKAAVQKGAEKAPKVQKEKKEKKSKRSFKAIYKNPAGDVVMEGRYCGAKPKQAGSKALTGIYKLFAKAKKALKGEIFFGVKETTRGSRNKTYYYSGERAILDKPIKLQIGGGEGVDAKTIVYKYGSKVKKATAEECDHLSNPIEVADKEAPKEVAQEVAQEVPKEAAQKKGSKKAAKVEKVVEAEVEVKVEAKVEAKVEPKAKKQKK